MGRKWTESDIPDLHGKTAIVTGGNSGIGFEAALALARHGARVVLACRDPKRAADAVETIRKRSGSDRVEARALDLSRLASVRAFADEWLASGAPIDLLINNAGVMALPKSKTEDGYETQFATNHLGHFALTMRLLPALEKAPEPRVVTVSSMTHSSATMNFDDLHGDRSYSPSLAYTQSKLANLLFAYELERKLRASGRKTKSVACHPGWSATHITYRSMESRGVDVVGRFLVWGNSLVGQPAEQGAWPTLYAATSPAIFGGEYVGPSGIGGTRGTPAVARSSPNSYDTADAFRLWTISEQLTGERFD